MQTGAKVNETSAPTELKLDLSRGDCDGMTGIYVRAKGASGWGSFDIACLDRESLHAWLRSRGGDNIWAENVVLLLLGYYQISESSSEGGSNG